MILSKRMDGRWTVDSLVSVEMQFTIMRLDMAAVTAFCTVDIHFFQ